RVDLVSAMISPLRFSMEGGWIMKHRLLALLFLLGAAGGVRADVRPPGPEEFLSPTNWPTQIQLVASRPDPGAGLGPWRPLAGATSWQTQWKRTGHVTAPSSSDRRSPHEEPAVCCYGVRGPEFHGDQLGGPPTSSAARQLGTAGGRTQRQSAGRQAGGAPQAAWP